MSTLNKYTLADCSRFRWALLEKLDYLEHEIVPSHGATTETLRWFKPNAPNFEFFWSPATDRQKTQTIVTLVGNKGFAGLSEDEDVFPSDEMVAKIRLMLL